MSSSDRRDFAEFYAATWARTVACAYAVTADLAAAEDVAQEAYARAWPRWRRLCDYDDPGAWVRQVATRHAISRWRRSRTALRHRLRQRPPDPVHPPDENTVLLVQAMRQLPEAQRRALVLHHLAGLPVAAVAREEGCPEGTIKARLSRGRTALAALLASSDDPGDSPASQERSHA